MRESLLICFNEANIDSTCYEIIGPQHKPFLMRFYESINFSCNPANLTKLYKKYIPFKNKLSRTNENTSLKKQSPSLKVRIERNMVSTRHILPFLFLSILTATLVVPLLFASLLYKLARYAFHSAKLNTHSMNRIKLTQSLNQTMAKLKNNSLILHLYQLIHEDEMEAMNTIINHQKDVKAWYCPTAFWPSFNNIHAPRLICVPDVVMKEFAVGFSIMGERFLTSYRNIEKTISEGDYFVTYSEDVKWNTLVKSFHQSDAKITVIPHGANQLSEIINVSESLDDTSLTKTFCNNLFQTALSKAVDSGDLYKERIVPENNQNSMAFLFYASQFRPNKNIISLLKAYEYLLKNRFIQLKLVLTGNPHVAAEVSNFINSHQLENDVLCLHGLSTQELAACYRLATLSVNPSFSEGGCPFTFTESLSVGTPVVMARIAVTEEVITCPELQNMMLFDPYNWKEMAEKIEWGLKNRELLIEKQIPLYKQLSQRTWAQVIDEYITLLDKIAAENNQSHYNSMHEQQIQLTEHTG